MGTERRFRGSFRRRILFMIRLKILPESDIILHMAGWVKYVEPGKGAYGYSCD